MMHELALEFKENGHQITVLSPDPEQKTILLSRELDGVKVLSFRCGKIKNTWKTRRAINETMLPWQAWQASRKYLLTHSFDGIVYYSPTIFWGNLVKKLKRVWKCPTYLVLRDVFPQWAVDNGILSNKSPAYWYFKAFEKVNYASADTIGVMSPSNLEYFKRTQKDVSRFEVLYNWTKTTKNSIALGEYRKELNLENKVVLFYGGNIGHAQKMIYLIDLAKKCITMPNVHFLFVGKGDEVELLLEQKNKFNLLNITYINPVDQETYFDMLGEFDIGIFSLHPGHTTHNFPGKLLGYMSQCKPILGCVNPGNDLKEIVNRANAGIIVNSGDDEALFYAAKELIESEEIRVKMGQNGFRLLREKFSTERARLQITSAINRK